jgi:hypothetical protein
VQIALTAGDVIIYAGILTMVYYDAGSKKVYSLNAGYNTVQAEGDFAEKLVEAVIAKGQAIKLLSETESLYQRGFWIAIQIDPKTGKRVAVSPSLSNGCAAGY